MDKNTQTPFTFIDTQKYFKIKVEEKEEIKDEENK